ncbi:hypothetical protein [Massilia sp.]|uniref:hypothetical protein n=1 Tax=Massilia sp. TaxID=1882437 RepID=UPI00391AA00E
MKGNVMKRALHHDCALRGAITLLMLGLFLCARAASTRADGGRFDLLPTSMDNTKLCSSTPTKCVEKSAEDLRYERILEALKKMEGGERVYSEMATPADEPASYGPSQMVIDKILTGLIDQGGKEFTFTAKDGKSYTLTRKDLKDAKNRGGAMYTIDPKNRPPIPDLLDEAAKYNDYKDLTMPARTKAADDFLGKSGIPKDEWDTWWQRAVAYQKLKAFAEPLRREYRDTYKNVTGKFIGNVPNMVEFQKFLEGKGNIPSASPAVNYWTRFTELLDRAFPHETDKLKAIRPYLWNGGYTGNQQERWAEGFYSFYNRAAYSHPTIPYAAFKEGLAKWFDATPEAEESFIRDNIKAAAKHPDVDKDVKILHPDSDEEKIARYFASKHNSGGFKAIYGAYANKFVEHWKKIKWNFKCGKDPRDKSTSEPEPKEAQA